VLFLHSALPGDLVYCKNRKWFSD